METAVARLEETVRMCDATISRFHAAPAASKRLLDEVKRLRAETLAEIARVRRLQQTPQRSYDRIA